MTLFYGIEYVKFFDTFVVFAGSMFYIILNQNIFLAGFFFTTKNERKYLSLTISIF